MSSPNAVLKALERYLHPCPANPPTLTYLTSVVSAACRGTGGARCHRLTAWAQKSSGCGTLPGESVDNKDWSATKTGYNLARRAALFSITVGSSNHATDRDVGNAGETPKTAFHNRPWWAQMFRTRTKVRIHEMSNGSLIPSDLAIAVRSERCFRLLIRLLTCPKVRRSTTAGTRVHRTSADNALMQIDEPMHRPSVRV